jgi:hypothetical protein
MTWGCSPSPHRTQDVVVNPLADGLPTDEGWSSLRRLVDEVLPHL